MCKPSGAAGPSRCDNVNYHITTTWTTGKAGGTILALRRGVNECIVVAPPSITVQNRTPFREEALAALEQLGNVGPGGRLVLDLTSTKRVDSAGLGTLVMLQLRAAERRHGVCLRGVSEEIRFLLLLTRLEDRFSIEPSA